MERHYTKAVLVGKAADGDRPTYTFRITSEVIDRQGEVVTADGWQMDAYRANPVVLDSHNYFGIENIVGKTVDLKQVDDEWHADITFNASPKGRLAEMLVESGDLNAVSVGFQPLQVEVPKGGQGPVRHTEKELLEISVVPVPANQEALRVRSLGADESGAIWESVATAMVALMTPGGSRDDEWRKRTYRSLERVYRSLGKQPPEFKTNAELAALGTEELRGLFWEGERVELDAPATKAGRVLSAKNESALRQARDLIDGVLQALEPADSEDDDAKALDLDLSGLLAFAQKGLA